MSLIIGLGSNIGHRSDNLINARALLNEFLQEIAFSKIYKSDAVEYLQQPYFFNQVVEFKLPNMHPSELLSKISGIEKKLGRTKIINKGPRIIDIDILFWNLESISLENLTIPHPQAFFRSFVMLPLKELPFYNTIKSVYNIPLEFNNFATPVCDEEAHD